MVATDEREKEDTSPTNYRDEWETDHSEDDEAVSHDQPEVILNNRGEWQTEDA